MSNTLHVQAMIQGVLKGTGKQMSGAVLNFVAYYVVGFPVGVVLAVVVGMGTLGMWIGLLLGSVLQVSGRGLRQKHTLNIDHMLNIGIRYRNDAFVWWFNYLDFLNAKLNSPADSVGKRALLP